MEKGKLIVIEGPDGCGKSSLCKNVSKYFKEKDIKIKSIGLPYKSRSHSYILIKEAIKNKMPVDVIQSLMIMNIREIMNATVSDMLNKGINVLLDRWILSTLIYDQIDNGTLEQSIRIVLDKQDTINLYDVSRKYCKINIYPDVILYYLPDRDIVISHAERREKNKECDENDKAERVIQQYYAYSNYYHLIKDGSYYFDNHAKHIKITSTLDDERDVYNQMTNKAIDIIEETIRG